MGRNLKKENLQNANFPAPVVLGRRKNSDHEKEGTIMRKTSVTDKEQTMKIVVQYSDKKPNYKALAAYLYEKCVQFYQDPKNEEEYQNWLKKCKMDEGRKSF